MQTNRRTDTSPNDPLLAAFIEAAGEEAAQAALARLVAEHADPIIKRVVAHSLCRRSGDERQDAEDVRGEAHVRLLMRLRECRADPRGRPVGNLRGYVAVTAYHACHERLRHKYPERHALKDRLRYLLTHQPGFALWLSDAPEMVCGFAAWRERKEPVARASRSNTIGEDARAFAERVASPEQVKRLHLAEVTAAAFDFFGRPVGFDDLVSFVAELCEVHDRAEAVTPRRRADEADAAAAPERLPATEASVAARVEQREYLTRLWVEVRQLPPGQRAALLLNLRDAGGGGAIHLLPLVGVASIRGIAEALGILAERFAELWGRLPLDDLTIAAHLSVTRQQVINLRQAARKRLKGRMGHWP